MHFFYKAHNSILFKWIRTIYISIIPIIIIACVVANVCSVRTLTLLPQSSHRMRNIVTSKGNVGRVSRGFLHGNNNPHSSHPRIRAETPTIRRYSSKYWWYNLWRSTVTIHDVLTAEFVLWLLPDGTDDFLNGGSVPFYSLCWLDCFRVMLMESSLVGFMREVRNSLEFVHIAKKDDTVVGLRKIDDHRRVQGPPRPYEFGRTMPVLELGAFQIC